MNTRPWNAIIGGLAGTIAMTLMMYGVAPMMLGRPMDVAAMLGAMLGGSWILGMLLGIDARAASGGPTGQLSPVLAEASALPSQDGVGRHEDQSMPPAGPDSGQPDPQQAVGRAQPRPGRRSLIDGELLAQGQVLEGELARAADEEGEEAEQVEEEGDHRAEIVSGSEPIDQPLARRTEFWRRTTHCGNRG